MVGPSLIAAWMTAAFVCVVIGVILIVSGAARRHADGRRRCPHCGFDVHADAEPPCSECGGSWRGAGDLLARPARRRRQRLGLTVVALGILVIPIAAIATRQHWTNVVPRPILRLVLDATVNVPAPRPPAILPAPDPARQHARDRWQRLIWQAQAAASLDRFLDEVAAHDGTPAGLERLGRAAIEAGVLMAAIGGTRSADAWPMDRVERRLEGLRPELDARFDLPLGTWAASELQHFDGVSDQRWNWIEPPVSVLEALAASGDPRVREHAAVRASLIDTAAARALLETLAGDPDPEVRRVAAQLLDWRRSVRGWE